jgi:omega-hydroxy-beta-dihydromenaquinone-9 sulfotransferase
LIPDKRPMDNMKAGWALPQEDEFALMNLGAPTLYLRMMFPKNGFPFENTLSSDTFTPEEKQRWQKLFDWFMRALSYKLKKPLILKSPPHTGRIAMIREMYPDAKFIHIVRDPRKLFPSTLNLWKALDSVQGLQTAAPQEELQSFVFRCLNEMYRSFEIGRQGLASNQIIDVRYESLVKDPVGVMENAYRQLELGDFDTVRTKLIAKCEEEREFKPNRFTLDPALEERILKEWSEYATRYNYN